MTYDGKIDKDNAPIQLRCNCCGDIIIGDLRGTFIACKCGKIAIDQTPYYYRIIGNREDWEMINND